MKGPANLLETNLVSIHEAEVTSFVCINDVELHVGELGEGGCFVYHKPPGEGMYLIKIQLVVGREDFYVVPHVLIPVVYPKNILWSDVNCYCTVRWDVHDVVQSELDGTILEEVQDIVGVLDGGGYSILFLHFGGLGDEMPLMLPFLRLHLERFVIVQVNDGGICDVLRRGSDRDRFVGNGGCCYLGHFRD